MGAAARNVFQVNQGVDLWFKRVEVMVVGQYRAFIWEIFKRIVRETPQFSGKAVANWNLGIGAPDYDFNDSYGDDPVMSRMSSGPNAIVHWYKETAPHQKGDQKWIRAALNRNRPKLDSIHRRTKVFINNAVQGDDDGGATASNLYLQELQDGSYWVKKLREVNRTYETAQESVIIVASEFAGKGHLIRTGGFDMDGN
jgi:hypothetical protein